MKTPDFFFEFFSPTITQKLLVTLRGGGGAYFHTRWGCALGLQNFGAFFTNIRGQFHKASLR